MNPIIRNILAVIAGVIVGMVLNGFLITISSSIITPPEGADVTTMEGLKASLHLFEPRHFIVPFLAHSLGTFVGAILASALAATNKMRQALIVGILFLIGGITNVVLLPAPMWYNVVDLVGAYLPFAYVGGLLGSRRSLA
jgi:hypothetical protein